MTLYARDPFRIDHTAAIDANGLLCKSRTRLVAGREESPNQAFGVGGGVSSAGLRDCLVKTRTAYIFDDFRSPLRV